jgi:hypothetical protein
MPCPLFLPDSQIPLTGIFSGGCSADPGSAIPEDKLARCCNAGYARESCPHAAAIDVDAFRLLVRADDGASVEIAWASETNHHPVALGTMSVPRVMIPSSPLEHQARAYAEAYLRHTGRA